MQPTLHLWYNDGYESPNNDGKPERKDYISVTKGYSFNLNPS